MANKNIERIISTNKRNKKIITKGFGIDCFILINRYKLIDKKYKNQIEAGIDELRISN